eukprot:INCI8784.1.p1 GENE.INCI8784.1~~INCI8784.1.p1  ORF type:complete len:663 (+),score=101.23 INCI8784.1:337-2325(+)
MLNFTDFLGEDDGGGGDHHSPLPETHKARRGPYMPVNATNVPSHSLMAADFEALQQAVGDIEQSIHSAEASMESLSEVLCQSIDFRRLMDRTNNTRQCQESPPPGKGMGGPIAGGEGGGFRDLSSELPRVLEVDPEPQSVRTAGSSMRTDTANSDHDLFSRLRKGSELNATTTSRSNVAEAATLLTMDSRSRQRSHSQITAATEGEESHVVQGIVTRLAAFRDEQVAIQIQQDKVTHDVAQIGHNLPALLHHLMRLAEDIMQPHTSVRLFHIRAALRALPASNVQHRDSVAIDMARYYAQKLSGEHLKLHEQILDIMDRNRRYHNQQDQFDREAYDRDGDMEELRDLISTAKEAWVDWQFDLERAVALEAEYLCVDRRQQEHSGVIDKRMIAEVRSFKKPTRQLVQIVHAALLVLGYPVEANRAGGGRPKGPSWKVCCQHFSFRNQREILRRMRALAKGEMPASDIPRARQTLRRLFEKVDGDTAQHSNRHSNALYRWLRGVSAMLNRDDDLRNTIRVFGVLFPTTLRVRLPSGGSSKLPLTTRARHQLCGVYKLVPNVLFNEQVVYKREPQFDDRGAVEVSLCFADSAYGHWAFTSEHLETCDDDGERRSQRGKPIVLRSAGRGHIWPLGLRWQVLADPSSPDSVWKDVEFGPVCETCSQR